MVEQFGFRLPKLDWILTGATLGLLSLGLLTLQSSLRQENTGVSLLQLQFLAISIGLFGFLFLSLTDSRYLQLVAPFAYFISIILLVALFVFGVSIRGSVRWFDFGAFQLQPSEIVKPLLILFVAWFLTLVDKKINSPRLLLLFFSVLALPLFLIFAEPDLGTTIVLFLTFLTMLYFSGFQVRWFFLLLFLGLIVSPFIFNFLPDYQKQRFLSFLNPFADPQGSGYNLIQSVIAIGSGGFWGLGWGKGTQSHLQFLPEQHTDFVFATFLEEAGFAGALIVILLFGLIFWRGIRTLRLINDQFSHFLLIGSLSLLFWQIIINIGMNIGLFPITGIPLPFISYGGSSIVSSLIILGFISCVIKSGKA